MATVKGEGSAAEQIFEKLKAVEDARKQLWWYRAAVFTFDPNGRLRTYWDVFLMCLVLYSGFISPFRAVFERPTGSVELEQTAEDWLIDALFYMDIVLNFFTGYDNGYQIVTGKIEIAKKYVFLSGRGGGFFWVDLVATVQWDMLFTWLTDGGIGVAKLALLKMLKVARMLRFGRLITRVTAHRKVHTGYVEACKFFIYVLYVAHILACLFFLWSELFDCQSSTCTGTADIPVCEYTSGTTGCPAGCTDDGATCSGTAVAPSCTGVGLKPGECPAGCTYTPFMLNEWDLDVNSPLMEIRSGEIVELDSETLTERNDCVPTSWRHAYSMAGVSVNEMLPWSQWTQAFYWAITTMTTIGYGDRGPQNESEMVFTIVAELVGLAFFALLIQTINTLKEVIGLKEQEQRDTKNKLVDQMKRNDLSDDLIAKVVKFLNFKNTSKAGRAFLKEDPDFNELSHALQRQVSRETNLPYVKNVKILGHSMDDQLEMDNVKDIFEEANEGDDPNPALDRGEINNLVLKLGVSSDYFTKERLDEAMNSMDSSGDGEVELDEFQNWWYTQLFKRPRMKPCPKGLLDEIAECLECVPASPGDIIVPKLKYGESFFVLQAGKVVKRASDPKDRYHITETEVKHDDNDPFFGLQAVLPDLEFERIRPRLATMEIVVAENSYVECLSIKREHLRSALEHVEKMSSGTGSSSILQKLVLKHTKDLRLATSGPLGEEYEKDPARAVLNKLGELLDRSNESDVRHGQIQELESLRTAAWEWTNVDGSVMRGCEQLQLHAHKLTEEMTGSHAAGSRGPPDAALSRAVRARLGAGGGLKSSTQLVHEMEDTHNEVHETHSELQQMKQHMQGRMDGLEQKVEKTLRFMEHTHSILEALAQRQGVAVEPFVFEQDQAEDLQLLEGEPEASKASGDRGSGGSSGSGSTSTSTSNHSSREDALTPRGESSSSSSSSGGGGGGGGGGENDDDATASQGSSSVGSASRRAPLPARGPAAVTAKVEDHRSPIRRKAEAEGRTIGKALPRSSSARP